MKKVVTMDDFRKEAKRRELKEKAKQKVAGAVNWISNHKEEIAIMTPIILGIVAEGTRLGKAAVRHHNQVKEQELKELYCYDRSLGHYWKLRRPLSNNDWVSINARKQNGEALADILSSMKVLD